MKRFLSTILLAFALAVPAWAQDAVPLVPSGGNFIVAEVDEVVITKVKRLLFRSVPFTLAAPVDDNIASYKWIVPPGMVATDRDDKLEVTAAAKGEWLVEVKYKLGTVDGGKIKYTTKTGALKFLVGEVPAPIPPTPPDPPKPPPDPPKPKPEPVTSFRVVFIWESAKTLPLGQISVMDAKIVRDYLTANCTPEAGFAGWRKFDKDQDGSKESPTIAAMWTAIRAKVTDVPCVAVEVNGKVEIIPLAATPAAMIATFEKYKGGK